MKQELTILELSHWFLYKESMTHKKLQKICYYAVAWGWALMNKSIITDDKFQAWVHGPVAPKLYDEYKQYGWNSIPTNSDVINISKDLYELLESVWLTYGDKSGNELEALSHAELPWRQARGSLDASDNSQTLIDTDTMRDFYISIKSSDF